MARKTYSAEFRRDAVELYRVTEGATIMQIAGDLGITDATLSAWVKAAGVPVRGRHASTVPIDPSDELARLRAENEQLRAREQLLSKEKDILRAAAKYFAGETNW
jgi:transposase